MQGTSVLPGLTSERSDDGSEKLFGASPGEREATLWTSSSGTKAVRTANHSFAGIMFDVKNVSEWRVLEITEVHVAGALRRVRVYICDGSHSTALGENSGRWDLAADQICAESWYEPTRIRLNCLVIDGFKYGISPGHTAGIYIHSDSPGDDGLRYSSAWRSGVAYDDGSLAIFTGRSHTSPTPFVGGWWRSPRCLAGGVSYVAIIFWP